MPAMTTLDAGAAAIPSGAATSSSIRALLLGVATVIGILVLALLSLLTPPMMHAALDAADADAWLGLTPIQTHSLSDATVGELLVGADFASITGPDGQPFYGATEVAHLRDVRMVLLAFLAIASAAAIGAFAGRPRDGRVAARVVARAGALTAVGVLVLGTVGAVAFEPLFELFHRVLFPGGNWAFDARTSHLVQLYPTAFWEITAMMLGAGAAGLGGAAWVVGRHRAARGRPEAARVA